jgi:glycerophosphoryl diester phosphodiesterase
MGRIHRTPAAIPVLLLAGGLVVLAEGCGGADTNEQAGGGVGQTSTADAWIGPGTGYLENYLDCLSDARTPLVAAHRGGAAPGYPENAIETFAHTLSQVPALIETDVSATRNGVLVLMHDDDLARTSTCRGAVADTTWSALAGCRLKDDDGRTTAFTIPSLAEALAWADGRAVLEFDVKRSVRFPDVIDVVRAAHAEERVIIITYTAAAAARVARLAPEMTFTATIDSLDDLDTLEARGVDLEQVVAWTGTNAPDPTLYAALEAERIPVVFGTLGNPSHSVDGEIARTGEEGRYRAIAQDGVDIIATDRPVAAYQALAEAGDPTEAIAACRVGG